MGIQPTNIFYLFTRRNSYLQKRPFTFKKCRHLGVKLNIDNKYSSRNLCEVESQINEAIQKDKFLMFPLNTCSQEALIHH